MDKKKQWWKLFHYHLEFKFFLKFNYIKCCLTVWCIKRMCVYARSHILHFYIVHAYFLLTHTAHVCIVHECRCVSWWGIPFVWYISGAKFSSSVLANMCRCLEQQDVKIGDMVRVRGVLAADMYHGNNRKRIKVTDIGKVTLTSLNNRNIYPTTLGTWREIK